MAAVALAAAQAGMCGAVCSAAENADPSIHAIKTNLASALARARSARLLRVYKQRTGASPFVTALEWVDPSSGDQRWLYHDASGRLTTEISNSYVRTATDVSMDRRTVTVDYAFRTWSVRAGSLECAGPCGKDFPLSAACGCDLDPFTNFPGRRLHVAFLGEETVDRRPTFHLRFVVGGPVPSTTDFWIDRSSYLPVAEKVIAPTRTTVNDFTWLPRTSTDLAALNIVIPRSFKRTLATP